MKGKLGLLLLLTGMITSCAMSERTSPFAWGGYKASDNSRYFSYALPNESKWLSAKHVRVVKNKYRLPEKLLVLRGERPFDFSERMRELYIAENIDPVDFLGDLKASDEVHCEEVDFHILKKVDNGFLYREKTKGCRNHPNAFITYGKIVTTPDGLTNLQYQAVPSKVPESEILQMYHVILDAKLNS